MCLLWDTASGSSSSIVEIIKHLIAPFYCITVSYGILPLIEASMLDKT